MIRIGGVVVVDVGIDSVCRDVDICRVVIDFDTAAAAFMGVTRSGDGTATSLVGLVVIVICVCALHIESVSLSLAGSRPARVCDP